MTTHVVGHAEVLSIHTATVDGTITFVGLADQMHDGGDTFGWVNHFSQAG